MDGGRDRAERPRQHGRRERGAAATAAARDDRTVLRAQEQRLGVAEQAPVGREEAPVVGHEAVAAVERERQRGAGLAGAARARDAHAAPVAGDRGRVDHRGATADHRQVEQREGGHEQLAVAVQRQAVVLDPDPQTARGQLDDTVAVADAVGLAQPGQRRDAPADHEVLARVALGRERREQVLELARARRARGDAQPDAVVDREAQVRGARRAGAPPRGTRGREGAPGDEARARERHADRDRADAGQRGRVPGVDARRDVAGDRRAQRPGDVRALGGQRPAGAGEPADLRLRAALGVAARGEVAPRRALGRHAVVDHGARLVEDDPVGEPPPRAQAELGLLAADRHARRRGRRPRGTRRRRRARRGGRTCSRR